MAHPGPQAGLLKTRALGCEGVHAMGELWMPNLSLALLLTPQAGEKDPQLHRGVPRQEAPWCCRSSSASTRCRSEPERDG
ncbi:hypothetical protein H6G65_14175 [Microcystis elabens FACHB-917]|nr:hypothetical protein [Microcystis elabens FACHB-917]